MWVHLKSQNTEAETAKYFLERCRNMRRAGAAGAPKYTSQYILHPATQMCLKIYHILLNLQGKKEVVSLLLFSKMEVQVRIRAAFLLSTKLTASYPSPSNTCLCAHTHTHLTLTLSHSLGLTLCSSNNHWVSSRPDHKTIISSIS